MRSTARLAIVYDYISESQYCPPSSMHIYFFFFASTARTELVECTAFWGRHHKIYPVQLDRVLFLFLFSGMPSS
jgi:hypothetical protein